MSGKSVVTFLGCPLANAAAADLVQWQERLARGLAQGREHSAVRWLARPALHLTLHYLGTTKTGDIQALHKSLGAVISAHTTASVCLGVPAPFPPAGRARGFWVEVQDGNGQLHALQADLLQALDSLGLESRTRRFRPHITIGRMAGGATGADRRRAVSAVAQTVARFPVRPRRITLGTVHWYQSIQKAAGNEYHPLVTWSLPTGSRP